MSKVTTDLEILPPAIDAWPITDIRNLASARGAVWWSGVLRAHGATGLCDLTEAQIAAILAAN